MIKGHRRTHAGWLRRSSRVYLRYANQGKQDALAAFLETYRNAVNYAVVRFWSAGDFGAELAGKDMTDAIRERFGVTARVAQCAAKQAKETCRSQRRRDVKRMPRVTSAIASLDSRFASVDDFEGHFDLCVNFSSGVPAVIVPFDATPHMRKLSEAGWVLGKSLRLGRNENGVFIDLIYEKPKPPKKVEGATIGIDRGFNAMLFTSAGQEIGAELKPKIIAAGKRRKSYHHYIATEENRLLKELDLSGIRVIALERLDGVKRGKRGKFPRNINRLLSFWHYAKVGKRLAQRCEEHGVSVEFKDPWKTSQHCPACDNTGKGNRRGKRFKCLKCGYADDADHVGALNLLILLLAGAYSLRSLTEAEAATASVAQHLAPQQAVPA